MTLFELTTNLEAMSKAWGRDTPVVFDTPTHHDLEILAFDRVEGKIQIVLRPAMVLEET